MQRTPYTPRRTPAPQPVSTWRVLSALVLPLGAALILATLFTALNPSGLFTNNLNNQLALLLTAQPEEVTLGGTPSQVRIGIVAGHWGNDSGAVCGPDKNNTTEADVNLKIATLVQQKLQALGYQVDLLEEFDPRLREYRAAALVSIHNDSCDYINDLATGFKVAAAVSSRDANRANRLAACLRDRYQRATQLPLHNSITNDMTFYHAFDEIHPNTTAAIIETGFLNLDYDILTNRPELVSDGVVSGILCFINNENIAPTPSP
ncbi:MAG: N-acetylmuramoyl-L-alanine amidase [Anaerolineales bacterium]